MHKSILIIIVAVMLTCAAPAMAPATELGKAELPSSVAIEKNNDVSAAMISHLLGTEWQTVAGKKASSDLGGIGKFAGVFAVFLNILNLAAMAFVSISVIQQWGVAAVVTAHEGKQIGGSMFNSLWIPVRHAFSFVLVVPVTGSGLSLLQVGVLAMVSLSINFANVAWDSLGNYLISNAQTGVTDSAPPFVNDESMALIRPMFRTAVAQELIWLRKDLENMKKVPVQDLPDPSTVSVPQYISVKSAANGKFAVIHNPAEGKITIYPMGTERMAFGEIGAVVIPAPKMPASGEFKELEKAQYDKQLAIAQARSNAAVNMWEGIREWARYYISSSEMNLVTDSVVDEPDKSGLALAGEYRQGVMASSMEQIKAFNAQQDVQKILMQAVDSDGTSSKLGWVSAGLMPYAFSQAQKKLDDMLFMGGATFINVSGDYEVKMLKDQENAAIKGSYAWANDQLLQGRMYSPVTEDGDGPGVFNRLISGIFLDSTINTDNEGILSGMLRQFGKANDPIVVITSFGKRLFEAASMVGVAHIGASMADGSFITKAASNIPVIGSIVNGLIKAAANPLVAGAAGLLFMIAVPLYFMAPITILCMWLWALLKWVLTVIYVLIGAPLWAAAHLSPEGHGFAGEHARAGYYLVMDLGLRPILLTGGVIVSMATWQVAASMYNVLIGKYLNGFAAFNGAGVITELVFACVVMMIFFYIYAKIFSFCINAGPGFIMDLYGRRGASTLNATEEDGSQIANRGGSAAARTGAALGGGAALAGMAGKKSGEMYDAAREKLAGMRAGEISPGIAEKE